jgi:hypothetical protein
MCIGVAGAVAQFAVQMDHQRRQQAYQKQMNAYSTAVTQQKMRQQRDDAARQANDYQAALGQQQAQIRATAAARGLDPSDTGAELLQADAAAIGDMHTQSILENGSRQIAATALAKPQRAAAGLGGSALGATKTILNQADDMFGFTAGF